MCKRALIVSSILGFINFEKNDIRILYNMGYEIHIATNLKIGSRPVEFDFPVIFHEICFEQNPYSSKNMKAYKQLIQLLDTVKFKLMHCHTAVAAAFARIAARKQRKAGMQVVYTCHGFRFNTRSSKKTWMIYHTIERILAPMTDMIITINHEDYSVAEKFQVALCRYIPGVGLDLDHIKPSKYDREKIRGSLGIPNEAFVINATGELSYRKNHGLILNALLNDKLQDVYLILCGTGKKLTEYTNFVHSNHLEGRVKILGYRPHDDIIGICYASDAGIIPSLMEGLGMAGLECMAVGRPVIGSDVQGIKDYIKDGQTGFLFNPYEVDSIIEAIQRMKHTYEFKEEYRRMSESALRMAKRFDKKESIRQMEKNYIDLLAQRANK